MNAKQIIFASNARLPPAQLSAAVSRLPSSVVRDRLPFILIEVAEEIGIPPQERELGAGAAEVRFMGSKASTPMSDTDAEIERELRHGRKFTPEEAIGRLAGSGAMKGASVVPPQQQAENQIGVWLTRQISDPAGVLISVLQRQLSTSELLVQNLDQPLLALGRHCRHLLGSDHLLKDLVREVDAEWGRAMDERPYFEREGMPPHPADPYTIEHVRGVLSRMIRQLPS